MDVDPLRAPDASGGDPVRDLADACLDGLAEVARLEARTAALKIRLAAEYVQASRALVPPGASAQVRAVWEMALVAELACVLTVSERAAGALLSEAQALTSTLPLTLSALQAGTVSFQHARIMVDETASLDADGAAGLEAHFLDPNTPNPARGCPAGDLVPGRFRAKARAWRERHHRDSIEVRHTRSAADRRVEYVPDRDGMAWLSAYLPAGTAAGIWERSTAAARALQGPAEPRTLTQLRADLTATWLLTNNGTSTSMASTCMGGGVPSPRAQVLITVPVLSLLGATNEPATLDGYGPIPPSMARHLIADGAGSFYRVLTDPRDGAPLEIGRTSYRLTKSQRHWLRLRDGKCPFPGCSNHSLDNEADHLLAWADGGTTGISNLGQPCPKHHRLKHSTTWTPTAASTHHPPGWTAPSGRHYPSEHQDWEPPHLPPTNAATNENPGWNPPPGEDPDPDDGWGLREAQDQDPEPEPDEDPELPPAPFPDWHKYLGDPDLLPTPDADVPAWPAPRGPFPEKPAAPQRLIDFSHSTRSCRRRISL
ncbi:HNH endonuclease signature motif containing protein [Arthrobacter sp. H16F315]|uniref:HNH endonuclease signature motif containing protein n=1 Tax=Arthrobacter sp. H16F315 TaxID=2955314 RepID=UPI002097B19D|nr:HNH endonuclease signature motif containing protein [Arthrobacter sp. H16F315]MDD1477381.1 DUF222 domain-containing protein [Arthrobacter sp. H16F315]